MSHKPIIIVGAGPSGLLLALLLTQQGIPIHLVDKSPRLSSEPRATHYGPPGLRELRRAGILDEVRAQGFIVRGMTWRKLDGSIITGMIPDEIDSKTGERRDPHRPSEDEDPDSLTCLPLQMLGAILLKRLRERKEAKISFGWTVKGVGQAEDEEMAWVDFETEDGERKRLEGEYVLGCDGANSTVRKALFGNEFPGRTWDQWIVATNVRQHCIPSIFSLYLQMSQVDFL